MAGRQHGNQGQGAEDENRGLRGLADEGSQAEEREQEASLGNQDETPGRPGQRHQRRPEDLDRYGKTEDRHHLGDAGVRDADVLERNGKGLLPDRGGQRLEQEATHHP